MSHFYDPEIETEPLEGLREVQLAKLKTILEIAWRSNPFYQRKFREHGVSPEDIRELPDIEKLPFVSKGDFVKDQEENPPFGTNLSEPLDRYVRYHQTTGTTGKPLKWLDTRESWQWRGRCAAMSLWGSGVRSSDIVFFPFGFGPHVAYWGLFEGVWQIGALAIAGGGWDTLQRIKSIMENRVTVVCCTPTYALRMAEVAEENGIDLRNTSVRIMIHAGEPGALVPTVREKIEGAWGARPYDYPGLTEVGAYGIHCEHQKTSVHVNEGEFIIEVIDPRTEKAVPYGEMGEMVLTNLGRACSPAIRFRTGDLVRLIAGDCPCGRTFRILDGGILGRSDDMVIIRGINLFPPKVGEVVEKHLAVGEEYQMIATSERGGQFKVRVEFAEGRSKDEILKAIKQDLRQNFEIRIEVEAVPPGTLPRSDYKARRFIDLRTGVGEEGIF